jgi:hypothetical protein
MASLWMADSQVIGVGPKILLMPGSEDTQAALSLQKGQTQGSLTSPGITWQSTVHHTKLQTKSTQGYGKAQG